MPSAAPYYLLPSACCAVRAVAALAVTEPGGGSDVANLRTTAERDGDSYVVNGEKTFITGGYYADFITVAVRTGGEGAGGVSLLLVEGSTPGLQRTKLEKMGWHCSDTAHLHFDNCRVPTTNLIGEENRGFLGIMHNFNNERIMLAAQSEGLARACYEEALEWAQQRKTFGARLADHQVIRHKLVGMAARLNATRAFLNATVKAVVDGHNAVPEICQLKNVAVRAV
jgi:acyl-CoA dehydrogenase